MRYDDLSPRDRELVDLIVTGADQKEIAAAMGLKVGTVRDRVHELGRQLPGAGSPMRKLLLWRIRVALEAAGLPTNIGLPTSDGAPSLVGTPST